MQWNDAAILQGKRLIFLAVPDKFSAYRDCIADASVTHNKPATDICKQITANWMGAQPLNCPNLQELVESNRNTVIDLYRPNDGHFGNAGYSLLGKAVADALSGK
jgi:lysophospholipase L1-like esterase